MSYTSTTENLGLPQYVLSDKPQMSDFNAAYAAISNFVAGLPRIAAGRVEITPTAPNTPTRVYIRFPEGLFRSAPSITVTIVTAVPGTAALGASASEANKDGFYLYLTRNDRTQTGVYWQAIQMPE